MSRNPIQRAGTRVEGVDGQRRIRVAVVFGGRSSEHAISCISAGSVLAALDRDRYDVVPIGITPEGRWVVERDEPERLRINDGQLPEVDSGGAHVLLSSDPTHRGLVVRDGAQAAEALADVDVVFPVLHGPWGEDGTIQGLLELAGIPRGASRARTASGSVRHWEAVTSSYGPTSSPAASSTAFMWPLSMAAADAKTPEPT
jgi:D-alanine-D-alanine ligase